MLNIDVKLTSFLCIFALCSVGIHSASVMEMRNGGGASGHKELLKVKGGNNDIKRKGANGGNKNKK